MGGGRVVRRAEIPMTFILAVWLALGMLALSDQRPAEPSIEEEVASDMEITGARGR